MNDMDMITITRAQFKEAVKSCLKDFADTKPDSISTKAGNLLVFVCEQWVKGVEITLFGDTEEENKDEDDRYLPFN